MPKQTTLLQAWGYSGNPNPFEEDDEMDSFLAEALEKESAKKARDDAGIHGFDENAGRTWIYPKNYPIRSYQFAIVESCLFQNTLVSLPTGLGKTFIGAVVMYNYYRWYPQGVVVFLAPTKPLVAQQINACFSIMGIPAKDVAEMTGNVAVHQRKKEWNSKRVFFLTPQVLSNDLSRGLLPTQNIKCLVIDEAHRAQGDYAYCQVVRELRMSGDFFRVVALSATPGNDIKSVQSVLKNLGISKVELRSEDSPDITPYTFNRNIVKIIVPLGEELEDIKNKYTSLLDSYLKKLSYSGVKGKNSKSELTTNNITKYGLLQCRSEFRQNPPPNIANNRSRAGLIESLFASAISLYHAYELLLQHGMRPFYNFLMKTMDPKTGNRRLNADLNRDPIWNEILSILRDKFESDSSNTLLNSSRPKLASQFSQKSLDEKVFTVGHPKLTKLLEVVLGHFNDKGDEPSRVMVFSQYRDSVQEITACLHQHRPLVKAMEFVGQAGTKAKKGLTQKEQIEVLRRFREGGYNTLVSTCVGEEGLDIGEVDLIVCYDVSKSPIQLIQRMGRTGRKRNGKIVVLVTQGREEQIYKQCLYSKSSINKAIMNEGKLSNFLIESPRMVPSSIVPTCHTMEMIVNSYEASVVGSIQRTKRGESLSEDKKPAISLKEKEEKDKEFGLLEGRYLNLSKPKEFTWEHRRKINISEVENTINLSEYSFWQRYQNPSRKFVSESSTCAIYSSMLTFFNESRIFEPNDEDNESRCSFPLDKYGDVLETETAHDTEAYIHSDVVESDEDDEYPINSVPTIFEELYANEKPLDKNKFLNDLKSTENELSDYSFLQTVEVSYDELLKIYREVNGVENSSMSPMIHSSREPELKTSTPLYQRKYSGKKCVTYSPLLVHIEPPTSFKKKVPIARRSLQLSEREQSIVNFDVDFDEDEFFKEISFNDKKDNVNDPNAERDKSLYSASELASLINTRVEKSPGIKSINNEKGETLKIKEDCQPSEANFDFNFDSEDDMFADSMSEEVLKITNNPNLKRVSLYNAFSPFNNERKASINSPVIRKNDLSMKRTPLTKMKSPSLVEKSPVPSSSKKSIYLSQENSKSKLNISRDESSPGIQKNKSITSTELRASRCSEPSRSILMNESPLFVTKRKKRAYFSDSDDDFCSIDSDQNVHNSSRKRSSLSPSLSADNISVKEVKKKKNNIFIDNEAEVEDENSTDDEDSNPELDYFEESFVDDGTQQLSVDQQAMYLRSSHSSSNRGRFKMPSKPLPPVTSDIYSQFPEEDDLEYENDSFCVDDDFVEYDSKVEGDNTMALIIENAEVSNKKSRVLRPANDSTSSLDETFCSKILITPPTVEKSLVKKRETDKELVLVNTSQIHQCHELITVLKYELNRRVHVRSFEGASFILSSRVAVDRISYSQFFNAGQRHRILKQCQLMNDLFEKPFIILEMEEGNKFFSQRTKYADMILCQLAQSNIRLLYSKNQRVSAELLSNLLERESSKGYSFNSLLINKDFTPGDEEYKIINFYKSIPGIGIGLAYLLSSNYSTVYSFVTSAVSTLMRKGKIDQDKAKKIKGFLHRKFNPELTEFGK